MRKGTIVNLALLPKIGLEDENGKIKSLELAGLTLPSIQNYRGDLAVHYVLKKYLNQNVEFQLVKSTQKGKIALIEEKGNRSLGQILLGSGVATFNEEEAFAANIYTTQEIEDLKQTQSGQKLVVLNGIYDASIVKKAQVAKVGTYEIIEFNENIIISKDNYYLSVSLKNIELYFSDQQEELIQDFLKRYPTVEVNEIKFFYSLADKNHACEVVCDPKFELAIIEEGFGKLSLKGSSFLPKDTYEKALKLEESAKVGFKGLWKNYLDIYSLIYIKNNFLAQVIQVLEGHIYRLKNMVSGKIVTVELSTVISPIGQQPGAFEARQFARKQIIGKLLNVYTKKQNTYSLEAILVRLDDHESLDKILLVEGWARVKQDSINISETARLQDLENKAIENKVGLFNSSKNKAGIIRFQQLTVLNTKETIIRARQFAENALRNNQISVREHYQTGVIEGFKNEDTFKIRLTNKKAIINLKIEGIKALDSKLLITQYKIFKQNSLIYLEQHFLQRDVEVRVIQFDQKLESFIGEILLNELNVAQTLLTEGLVFIDSSWYVPSHFHQKQSQAKTQNKGLWNPVLMKLNKQHVRNTQKQLNLLNNVTISQIKEGNIVYYQLQDAKQKLATIIAPALKKIKTQLSKQEIKIGNICAAPFEGQLYRAKIVGFKKKNDNIVQVEYIDYGNTADVNKNELLTIPEELMIVEELAVRGTLLFLKKLKESNQLYDHMFDEIQAMLLQKQFNLHIVEDELLLSDPDSKFGKDDIFHSINSKILQSGFLKLDHQRLYKIDDSISKQLVKIENSGKSHKLGCWAGYQSESQIDDDMDMHIIVEKTMLMGSGGKKK